MYPIKRRIKAVLGLDKGVMIETSSGQSGKSRTFLHPKTAASGLSM